ncbi:MAG: hypothetical protein COW65_09630 [Cytophagales bacterium CG18_big_fil_WC_8_21_14_2_50_42_9]|nr:MAG: hypothetical protein COW65_09630 [Cytophagales bacterium CG18_big_fil_WC_8_21_14_2_50_42_9]
MSDINNPLFEDQKEFLERQKEEYKNALLNDVTQLKTQSQQVGKTLLVAGGALAGLWFLGSALRGKKKTKTAKLTKGKTLALPAASSHIAADEVVRPDGSLNYEGALHPTPVYSANSYQQSPQQPSFAQSILHSDMTKALTQQITAFLLVFLTKKLEEYLHDNKINDIASSKEPETRDIDFSYHEEDAV